MSVTISDEEDTQLASTIRRDGAEIKRLRVRVAELEAALRDADSRINESVLMENEVLGWECGICHRVKPDGSKKSFHAVDCPFFILEKR